MKSWEVTRWAKTISTCPTGEAIAPREKFLLVVLATYYNEFEDCARPAEETLAGDILASVRHCRRLLGQIERKGLMRIERAAGECNRYVLLTDAAAPARRPPVHKPVDNTPDPGHGCPPHPGHFAPGPRTSGCPPTPDMAGTNPGHSYVRRTSEPLMNKGEPARPAAAAFSNEKTRRWDPDDLWLKRFIDSEACFFIPMGALDDPAWWAAVAKACGGISLEFLKPAMAKMRAWVSEGRGPRPGTDAEWKDFVRRWLCRENEWAQRIAEVRRAS